jgi:DNA-binding transcriptional regulator YdaS (Cro superfamily)
MSKLLQHLRGLPDRAALAEKCGTTRGHLNNVAYGLSPCSPELANQLEIHTDGAITRQDMRPDDFARIWPDLAQAA